MIREGDMNLVGGFGALLALQKLRDLGEIKWEASCWLLNASLE
jgi:hypothetical protein